MHILILANNDEGLYKFRGELLEEFLAKQHEVFISLPYGEFIPMMQEMGCQFIRTEFNRRGMNPLADIKLLLSYIKVIRAVHPDIILTYTVKPNIYGGLAAKLTWVPCIANITGLGTAIQKGGMMRRFMLFMYRLGLRKSACMFFQNRSNMDFFTQRRIVKGNTRLIPGSGVNLANFMPTPYPDEQDGLRFLFIGRIMRDKGIEELLSAAEAIRQTHPEATFTILGSCDEDYGKRLREAEQKSIITWPGLQKDVRPYIANSHCTVLPSYHEGTANVLLESAAMGRPVIATRVPGCRETYEESLTGLGCEARSAIDLTRAIKAFIALPQNEKAAMGLAGRKKMEAEFDRQKVIDAYYQEIRRAVH